MKKIQFLLLLCFMPMQALMAGQLIEVCGIDGSGKSTFVRDLAEELEAKGHSVAILQPARGDVYVRQVLKELDSVPAMHPHAQLDATLSRLKHDYYLLYFLQQKGKIEKLLGQTDYVICDRYTLSHIAYQECFGADCSVEKQYLVDLPKADFAFLVDIPIEEALQRIQRRDADAEPYENEGFLSRVQTLFQRHREKDASLITINGTNPRKLNTQLALHSLGMHP